jgi:hypothetical protein
VRPSDRRLRRAVGVQVSGDRAPAPPGYSDASIVDRITVNAHILETGTESYQLRTSKTHHRKRA